MHVVSTHLAKCWLGNVNMLLYCDVTKNVYSVTMTTVRHCSKQEFGRGHTIKQVALGITRPLHATVDNTLNIHRINKLFLVTACLHL